VVLPFGLYPQALGLALMVPVMIAGVKKFTNVAQRSVAFSLYYALMNLGFAAGDWMFDRVRSPQHGLGEHGQWLLPGLGMELSTYRVLILLSVVFTVPGLLLVWCFLREGVEMTEKGVTIAPKSGSPSKWSLQPRVVVNGLKNLAKQTWQAIGIACGKKNFARFSVAFALVAASEFLICYYAVHPYPDLTILGLIKEMKDSSTAAIIGFSTVVLLLALTLVVILREIIIRTSATGAKTVELFDNLWPQQAFRRFLVFMSLVVGVRMVFYHLAYTFPKYGIRELGDGAPIAQVSSMLNSVMIVVLVPICGVLTQKVTAYRMVSVGSLVSALSVFCLAVPASVFQPLADGWLGHLIAHQWLGVDGAVNPLYVSIFLFIVLLSIGEALWSPRLYEYAAAIAPKGQEASYMALSLLPYFLAKFVVGGSSGWLLAKFCPAEGPRHPEVMWFLIGLMALVTPLGTFIFRRYIQVQETGREPVISQAEAATTEEEKLRE
jgi:hypothetical protein